MEDAILVKMITTKIFNNISCVLLLLPWALDSMAFGCGLRDEKDSSKLLIDVKTLIVNGFISNFDVHERLFNLTKNNSKVDVGSIKNY